MPHGVHLLLEIDCWSSAVVRIGSASALNKGACFFTYNEVSICWEGVCVCVCVLLCVLCVHYPAADLCNVEGFSVNTFPWWKGVDPSLFLPHLHSSFTPSTGIEQRHQSAVSAALEFPLFSDKNRASPLWAGTFGGGEAITHQGRFSFISRTMDSPAVRHVAHRTADRDTKSTSVKCFVRHGHCDDAF